MSWTKLGVHPGINWVSWSQTHSLYIVCKIVFESSFLGTPQLFVAFSKRTVGKLDTDYSLINLD